MANFYHVLLAPKPGMSRQRIEKKFNYAIDWFRLNETCWVVYTSRDAETWFSRLREFVEPGGKLFISRLDLSDRQGWAPKAFWEWLKQDRSKQASQ